MNELLGGLPDKLGLHWVVERHEHLRILANLTHHILQSHKEGKSWCGGKLCLSCQINILLLRLSEKQRNHSENWVLLHWFLPHAATTQKCTGFATTFQSKESQLQPLHFAENMMFHSYNFYKSIKIFYFYQRSPSKVKESSAWISGCPSKVRWGHVINIYHVDLDTFLFPMHMQ